MNKKLKQGLLIALGCVLIAAGSLFYWQGNRLERYQVLQSPDHRYRLIVYRKPIWPSTMPGQASDAPGIVRLYDASGHLLNEAPLKMVQQVNDVEWSADHVQVPLVFNFKLKN